MSYLKDDLDRLIRYAQGLGIKVQIKDYEPGSKNAGGWATDGTEIDLYKWPRQSKVQLILILVHELAHHLSWVYAGRKVTKAVENALDKENNRVKNEPPIHKRYRKLIYESEKHDAQYQEIIANEVGLKIPLWKLRAERDADIWGYQMFYETGKHPNQIDKNKKRTELRKKYKNE